MARNKPVAVVPEPTPVEAPPPAAAAEEPPPPAKVSLFTTYATRAVTGTLGPLRTAQSTALQRYAAWILALEAAMSRSLAAAETFLLGTLKQV